MQLSHSSRLFGNFIINNAFFFLGLGFCIVYNYKKLSDSYVTERDLKRQKGVTPEQFI